MDWYRVVTEGRMDRFMPPFRSLSDGERRDVAAYALTLSIPEETMRAGEAIFAESCAACHTSEADPATAGPDFAVAESLASFSLEQIEARLIEGGDGMPNFSESLDSEQRASVAAYVRVMAFAQDETQPTDAQAAETGEITGQIINGTAGAQAPGALEVTLVGFDGDQPALTETTTSDEDGSFRFSGLEIVPGRIYGAFVEYQGVRYFSAGGHLLPDVPELELPLTVFETSAEASAVRIDRLHIILDFPIEDFIEITELWLVGNESDHTVLLGDRQDDFEVVLPEGFQGLSFPDPASAGQFTPTETGFTIGAPLRAGETTEVIFSFQLPFKKGLDFEQATPFPTDAIVILTAEQAPAVTGEGVQDLGLQNLGGTVFHSYARGALEGGSSLTLSIKGRHPASTASTSNSGLLIGLVGLGLGLVVAGLVWGRALRRGSDEAGPEMEADQDEASQEALLRAIAALDEEFERGDIDEEAYREQREALKGRLIEEMRRDD